MHALKLPRDAAGTPRPTPPALPLVGGYLAAYVALDWISYIQPVGSFPITAWNPPPGLSVALLLVHGARYGGWLFVAALAAELLVRGVGEPPWTAVVAAALPALAYSAAAAVLRRFTGAERFESLRDAAIFLGVVFIATGAVAGGLVGLYHLAGVLTQDPSHAVAQSWIGDFVGITVTTPAIMLAARRAWPRASARQWLVYLGTFGGAFWVAFGSGLGEQLRLFYVLFLPLVLVATQQGIAGAALAMVTVQVGLVALVRGMPGALLDFQFLMLALCITGLLLGAAVSERRRIERALRDKQFELDRSLRLTAASELASALAHELQQPLTALGNYVRAAALMLPRRDVAPAETQSVMQKALAETERASLVVRRLRDFFRTGSASLELVDPRALAEAAAVAMRERAERHRIGLAVVTPVPHVLPVKVDRIQIEGVLCNLVGNAIDALKGLDRERRIAIVVAPAPDGVSFSVEDNGPGVVAAMRERLFQHFETSKPHGMGLGLAISRTIVQAHGGRISYEPLAPGTAMRFVIPAAA
jgi:signal transduction histidine kinase